MTVQEEDAVKTVEVAVADHDNEKEEDNERSAMVSRLDS